MGDHRQHRPEDLLAGDPHVVAHPGEDRRADEPATLPALGQPLAAGQDLGALLLTEPDVVLHPVPLFPADHRPDLDSRHRGGEFRQKGRQKLPRNQDAGAGDAGLAAIHQARSGRCPRRLVEIGVIEDQRRTLAAQLQRHPLEGPGRRPQDGAPGRGRTGETDFGDVRMAAQFRPDHRAGTGDDIDQARRNIALVQRPGDQIGL